MNSKTQVNSVPDYLHNIMFKMMSTFNNKITVSAYIVTPLVHVFILSIFGRIFQN